MFTFVLIIALILATFAQNLPPSFSLCYMDSPIGTINSLAITPFPIQAATKTSRSFSTSPSPLKSLLIFLMLVVVSIPKGRDQITNSFPPECGESCGPGNITHEKSIAVSEDLETGSINVTVRAFNGVGEVDGIFCIQGTLEFVGV
jgi:hypothetical protein